MSMPAINLPEYPTDLTDRNAELKRAASLIDTRDLIEDTLAAISEDEEENALTFTIETLKRTCPDPDLGRSFGWHVTNTQAEAVGLYVLGLLNERYAKTINSIIDRMTDRDF